MKRLLDKVYRNKTLENGIWLYLLQIFNTVIPLMTLPYITRILGPEDYGIFSIGINLVGYLQIFIEYGFNLSATRKVVLSKNKTKLNKLFTAINYARWILLFISFLIVLIFVFFSSSNLRQNMAIMILFVSLIGVSLQQNWLFQGLQEMKYISLVSIIGRVISVLLTFIFVKSPSDLFLYCFLYSISPLIGGICSTFLAIIKFGMSFIRVSIKEIIDELREGWYVFTTSLSGKVFGSIGITFLGFFSDPSSVGIYSAINKVPNILFLIWAPISQVIYPLSSKKISDSYIKGKDYVYKVKRYILPIFSLMSIFISINAKTVITLLYGEEYSTYYYWIFPLLAWLIVSINNNFLGVQILLASGHEREYSKSFFVGILATIVFNFIFIMMWGGNGAAVAPVFSEIVLNCALKQQIRKIESQKLQV